MKSFGELKQEFHLDQRKFWWFLQIRHCIKATLKTSLDPLSGIQELFLVPGIKRIRASKFYGIFREARAPHLEGLKLCWERDLGIQIAEDSWKKLLASWYGCSRETQSQLIQYKLLHRSYWTPSKLVKLKLVDRDTCWKCQKETGTLVYMLYGCRKNYHLWDGIITLLKGLFQLNFSKSQALCILGLVPDCINLNLNVRQGQWVRLAAVTGCRIILRHWKSSDFCCFKEWSEQMTKMALYEQITYRVKGREDIFNQVWGPFLQYIEDMSV